MGNSRLQKTSHPLKIVHAKLIVFITCDCDFDFNKKVSASIFRLFYVLTQFVGFDIKVKFFLNICIFSTMCILIPKILYYNSRYNISDLKAKK